LAVDEAAGGEGRRGDLLATLLVVAALGAAGALAVIRILTHHPFHDECIHVHNLYLISVGLEPHVDFWCNYPVSAYVLTWPLFALLPPTAKSLFGLRFLMLALAAATGVVYAVHGRRTAGRWIWGAAPFALLLTLPPLGRFLAEYSADHFAMLAAVGAITLFFTRPRPFRTGAAAALCLLSVALMPKYAMPLLAGMVGYSLAGVRRPLATSAAIGLGATGAGLLLLALHGLGHTSPLLSLRYSFVFMAEFKLDHGAEPMSLAATMLEMLLRNPPLLAVILLGVTGWISAIGKRPLSRTLGPGALLAGTVAVMFVTRTFMAQYVLPVMICLVAFAPFAERWFPSPVGARRLRLALGAVMLAAVALSIRGALGEFERTPLGIRDTAGYVARHGGLVLGRPAIESLKTTQELMDRVPEDELVVGSPQLRPFFRRDLTYVTVDERPSFGGLLEPTDPAFPYFQPSCLRRRLAERPPAYIDLNMLELNYPVGWRGVLEEYLRRNPGRYVPRPSFPDTWLRADLPD
jgi:hypothetical protein